MSGISKKLAVGIIVLAIATTTSITVAAATYLPWTKNIYLVSDLDDREDGRQTTTVSTFDDRGNKCYIAKDKSDISISCVRVHE